MRIRKYDFNYGRRALMKKAALGAGAGVLMPLHQLFAAEQDLGKAYPDELLSIEMMTKGQIKTGDYLTADNVDIVKDLLDPIVFDQIKTMNRKIRIKKTETDFSKMFPYESYQASLRNLRNGVSARFDADGNVVTHDGQPWVGGLPFLDPKTGDEVQANMAMSWGRGDYNQYAVNDTVFNPDGSKGYSYDLAWAELQVQGRNDGTVFRGMNDLLRLQTVLFTATQDVAGSSFLSIWYRDQRKFPDLYGYLPQFRRVRQFPTNQRFEPLIPGVTWFLSDTWSAGDPMRTWGEFKILNRKPMLGAFNTNWGGGQNDNWVHNTHGGPNGDMFFDVEYELAPEVVMLESKPIGFPRAPVGRRISYVDVRSSIYSGSIRYDRQDKPWANFETGFGQYVAGDKVVHGPDGKHPAWSWLYIHSFDAQSRRMSRITHQKECAGGYQSLFKEGEDEKMYSRFFTQQALQRLGQV
ncbi:DUF1329 domain-containing protein [Sinimarinibacterium sp. NLF-5-8]|uniref:DUF1329 domain-containing protein n=1 Tax=Sinimarinibacterium sp. NLF-5-8 TaxID=2698684 RepID=UPI00137BB154|nr:DUF1329 domain-containing protein [Sinimarinibacterium sp. NLF-5-8]QHS10093.1 DUF1329 domain-containing protein [Sinimarinibacterium sp. NLF-5-8]